MDSHLSNKELIAEELRGASLSAKIIEQNIGIPSGTNMAMDRMYQSMNDNKHSWTTLNGYTRHEVDYAFHNHGAHHELLDMDVTDIASHYVLLHFDAQNIDESQYELEITGLVAKPCRLTLSRIKSLPAIRLPIVMECAGSDRVSSLPRFNHHSPWGLQPISQAIWTG